MVLRIRSVERFLLHVPIDAGSASGSAHTCAHLGPGTAMLSEDGDYVWSEMPGADWTLTEAAMSSYAKPF